MSTESRIERASCAFATALGIRADKLKLASMAGWPDRTFLYKGRVMFIEFKAPGEKPTALQDYTLKELGKSGFETHVCSDYEHAQLIILAWKNHVDSST